MGLHWGCSLRIPWLCSMGRSLGCPHGTPMQLHCYCSIAAAWKCLRCNTFWTITMWLLWDGMGIDHWECHGMALWAMHWEPMGLHWGCSLRIPWRCSMGRSLGCPHGTPMALHCYCSIGAAEKCLMCNTFGIPHVASMGLDGV